MSAMDAERLQLYELLKPKLDDEPARALVLALPPNPDTLVTKSDLDARFDAFEARLDARFARLEGMMDSRFGAIESRFGQIDGRFGELDGRFGQIEGRFGQIDGRFGQMEATLTCRMVTILGGWTILVGSTVGWVAVLLR